MAQTNTLLVSLWFCPEAAYLSDNCTTYVTNVFCSEIQLINPVYPKETILGGQTKQEISLEAMS